MKDKKKTSIKHDTWLVWLVAMTLFVALVMAVLLNSVRELRNQRLEIMEQELRLREAQSQQVTVVTPEPTIEATPDVVVVSDDTPSVEETTLVMPEETETYTCSARQEARCYQYPDSTSAVIGRVKSGLKVEVGEEAGDFYLVMLDDGTVGYMEKRFLTKDGAFVHVPGAVDLREYLPQLEYELLFASPNNITGHPLYPAVPLLEENTAEMLKQAEEIFERDGYMIKIYDAYRPKRAQYELYDIVQDNRYIANPYTTNSWHQLGRAVDMSLVNMRTGEELEMPTPMHTFDSDASRFNSSRWTEAAKANVEYMTSVMTSVGFGTISTEWWHFENTKSGGYLDVDMDLSSPLYN